MSDEFDLAGELDWLAWQHELECRAWERTIEGPAFEWYRQQCEIDLERSGMQIDERAPLSGQGASDGGGLVSVSTTGKRSISRVVKAKVLAAATDRASRVDTGFGSRSCFVPDRHKQRVSHLRRAVGFGARAHGVSQRGFRSDDCLMVTLTYANGDDWKPCHVKELLRHVRQWCNRREIACRYVWVAELQKRGAIHYHIALFVPHGTRLPMPDKCGWWDHGFSRIEVARSAVPYLLKYLSKGIGPEGLQFPKGARVYGVGGLEHSLRRARRWLGLPAFIQARSSIDDDWRRLDGGGWIDPRGQHWPSEYQGCLVGGVRGVVRILDHGRPFDPAGPFCWIR